MNTKNVDFLCLANSTYEAELIYMASVRRELSMSALPQIIDKTTTACLVICIQLIRNGLIFFYFYCEIQMTQAFLQQYSKQIAQTQFADLQLNKTVVFQSFGGVIIQLECF